MRYFKILYPFKKLDILTNKSFKVLEKVGHLYRLELLASIKVHNVFPASKLRRDPNDPLPGQVQDAPPPINITGDDE